MTIAFNRKKYFDAIRSSLFGSMSQRQVDGQDAILVEWEKSPVYTPGMDEPDLRHLAYPLATTYHETSKEMHPIEEYGKGKGMSYGVTDKETGQTYYGRGFVQLTWRENYAKADKKLSLTGDRSCEWHAGNALVLDIAADIMFRGMDEGWFRTTGGTPNSLSKYFSLTKDDPYNARDIINGDRATVPTWSNGVSIGNLVKGYHGKFLAALNASLVITPDPEPEPLPQPDETAIYMGVPSGTRIFINGVEVIAP